MENSEEVLNQMLYLELLEVNIFDFYTIIHNYNNDERIIKSKYIDSINNINIFINRLYSNIHSIKMLCHENFSLNKIGISLIYRSLILDSLLIENIRFKIKGTEEKIFRKKINDYLNCYANSNIKNDNDYFDILIKNIDSLNRAMPNKNFTIEGLEVLIKKNINRELSDSATFISKDIFKNGNDDEIFFIFQLYDLYTKFSKVEHFSEISLTILGRLSKNEMNNQILFLIFLISHSIIYLMNLYLYQSKIEDDNIDEIINKIQNNANDILSIVKKNQIIKNNKNLYENPNFQNYRNYKTNK